MNYLMETAGAATCDALRCFQKDRRGRHLSSRGPGSCWNLVFESCLWEQSKTCPEYCTSFVTRPLLFLACRHTPEVSSLGVLALARTTYTAPCARHIIRAIIEEDRVRNIDPPRIPSTLHRDAEPPRISTDVTARHRSPSKTCTYLDDILASSRLVSAPDVRHRRRSVQSESAVAAS